MEITYVHKFLAEAGLGSRRAMVEAMKAGKVKVNGRTIQDPRYTIDPSQDVVQFGKQKVSRPEPKVYLMMNKPVDVVTTTSDEQQRKTVIDLLPESYADYRLFPVGRLDQDTEGLLILTNDGQLTYKLTHPKFEHEKEYEVMIAGELDKKQMREMRRGLLLEDGWTAPATLKRDYESQMTTYLLTIHEGRKRQVRRMFEHLGHRVLQLKRRRIGGLYLDPSLKPGQVRTLKRSEIELLQQSNQRRRTLATADQKIPVQSSRQAIKEGKLRLRNKK